MHSEQPLKVQVGDAAETNLEADAQQMIFKKYGTLSQNHHEVALLRFPEHSLTDSYMFGAENRTSVPMEAKFNMGGSMNFECSGSSHVVKKIIQPRCTEFLMYVKRANIADEMLVDFHFTFKEA
eukprot:CAMPEP_0202957920 /NCGR_PEP_ID=MMETSP1396-20130829/2286_1 /ASSEMBLY_ACC=CAM_ASM_000872 /TAXON_ID= /ORGANISM="Pseudokeronopsis sp., Strain Brazil" /LENGTH=123 /DNA_ID=CAMNT_0049675659 /DNA_START=2090 /DNA_END=2461 /DNA_ORIENTATION=-